MEKQLAYTEEVLFNNYMVSSLGEEYVHSQIPFYFDKITYNNMVDYSEEINRISLNILNNITGIHKCALNYFDDFPLKDKIFNLKCPIAPMFWARYDTFNDINNNIFFAEFNYDKPCGQKEMDLAGKSDFRGNLNKDFLMNFISQLMEICNKYENSEEIINVGFLMDPCHYEELHHGYYFKHVLKNTNINIVLVGPKNLCVKEGQVYAYSEVKLPIILRLFPTEFFHEITNINEVLNCVDKGKLLLINDPRIVAIQAKGFFAYLWELVKKDSKLLSQRDKEIISKCIPYTELFKWTQVEEVITNKDKYVIKASLGRYSQEVYIGKIYSEDKWKDKVMYVLENEKIHVKQDLIEIKEECTYVPGPYNMNIPALAFGNFGVYLIRDKVQGFLVRWSKSFLTNDNYTWMCPLGVEEFPILIEKYESKNRKEIWEDVVDEITFKYDFTGAYTNNYEYISLNSLIIDKDIYEEMYLVSNKFCSLLKKLYPYIQKNMELFGPILGIPDALYRLVSKSYTSALCALGRIDFAIDNNGELYILEFNSETPAGLVESVGGNAIIKERLKLEYKNPNKDLKRYMINTFSNILNELKKKKEVKNIGVVTSWYYEDIYTSKLIAEILRELDGYEVIFGNIYDLEVIGDKLYLYGRELDAIYRHYPLDWFYYEEEMKKLIEILNSGDYLINPGHTLIIQSKAFFAVIHELVGKGFFTEEDEKFIEKYIPYTCLERDYKLSSDYVVKPYLSREGEGVCLSCNKRDVEIEDVIYQNRVNIRPLGNKIYSTIGEDNKYQYPVIGVYVTDDEPSGVFTRMGDFVTNKNAIYIPTYIK